MNWASLAVLYWPIAVALVALAMFLKSNAALCGPLAVLPAPRAEEAHENHMWTKIARVGINYQWGTLGCPGGVLKQVTL